MGFDTFLELLKNNRQDLMYLVEKVGGIGGLFDLAPHIIRIMATLGQTKSPVDAAEHVQKMLYYGAQTKDRVAAFQKAHGLDIDGIVGDETWRKVEQLIGSKIT